MIYELLGEKHMPFHIILSTNGQSLSQIVIVNFTPILCTSTHPCARSV